MYCKHKLMWNCPFAFLFLGPANVHMILKIFILHIFCTIIRGQKRIGHILTHSQIYTFVHKLARAYTLIEHIHSKVCLRVSVHIYHLYNRTFRFVHISPLRTIYSISNLRYEHTLFSK